MSLARRHRDGLKLKVAVLAVAATADATAKPRAKGKAAAQLSARNPSGPVTPAGQVLPPPLNARHGLAWRHRQKFAAAAAQAVMVAAAANDNDSAPPPATPYDLQRLQLVEALRTLKRIESIERKVAHKREILPTFLPWIDGVLEAAAKTGQAAPDEVVATMMVWAIDVADYPLAIRIADHVLRYALPMPPRFARKPAVLVTEEIADAALAAFASAKPFPAGVLADVEILAGDADMPDEVKARLFKAIGLEQLRAADDDKTAATFAGGRPAALTLAQTALRRALELHEKVGVKKELERIERELKKGDQNAPSTRPRASDEPSAGSSGDTIREQSKGRRMLKWMIFAVVAAAFLGSNIGPAIGIEPVTPIWIGLLLLFVLRIKAGGGKWVRPAHTYDRRYFVPMVILAVGMLLLDIGTGISGFYAWSVAVLAAEAWKFAGDLRSAPAPT